mgnify:FL=1
MSEIDYDAVRAMPSDELVDAYKENRSKIKDLYAEGRPLEQAIRARMEKEGTVALKSEINRVKLAPQKPGEIPVKLRLAVLDLVKEFLGEAMEKAEHESESALVVSEISKGKVSNAT